MKHWRRIGIGAALAVCCALLFTPQRGYTHEPITTNVRFNKEVIRIFERNCLGCHAPGQVKADIPLGTYAEARPWAKAIKEEILEKRMPPYQAVKGYGHFHRDYALSQREIDLIISWVEGGAPKGDDKDLPKHKASDHAWALGTPDLILQPTSETKVGAEADETRCFQLPTGMKEDRWISAVEFRPGAGTVVQEAMVLSVPVAKAAAACQPGAGDTAAERLAHWVPGAEAIKLPTGVARALPTGASLILKIRYQGAGEDVADRSSVALYFAKGEPTRHLQGVTVNAPVVTVPAAAEEFRVKASYVLPAQVEAVGVRPLLFPLATSVEVSAHRPDGTIEVLAWVKNRRWAWEPTYLMKKPVELPKGTRLEVTAYLNNTDDNPNNPHDPPKAVRLNGPLCDLLFAVGPVSKLARQ